MAMEDTREFGQRPKVDVYDKHVLVVFYTARVNDDDGPVAAPIEVHVYVSGDFIVTVRREACDLLDRLHTGLKAEDTDVEDYLVYRIFDTLTDAWYPVIAAIETRVDALEAEVLERARREQLAQIYRLRQEVREHHRLLADQRDHFQPAAEAIRNLAGLSRGAREYLRDVGDHLSQVTRRVPAPERRPPVAGQHLLQRQRRPAEPRRDPHHDRRHAVPRLDARDRLLRPELRVAGPQREHEDGTSCCSASAGCSSRPSCS